MTSAARKILDEALTLPAEEREALVDALNASLEPREAELSAEWITVIEQRISAVERGASTLVPGDEVRARVRARLREV